MRATAFRRVLTTTLHSNHRPPCPPRIPTPTLAPQHQDDFWHQCFQRAYARSALSKHLSSQEYLSRPLSCSSPTARSTATLRRHHHQHHRHPQQRLFTTNTNTIAQPILKHHGGNTIESPAGSPLPQPPQQKRRPSRTTKTIMTQLHQSLQSQDLKSALPLYLHLRHRTLPSDQVPVFFRYQLRLVQLFHRTRLEILDSNSTTTAQSQQQQPLAHVFQKRLDWQEWHRQGVLKDVAKRTLKETEDAEYLATLVDALGRSRAMVQYSYARKSDTKLKDWREALAVLEDWANARRFWIMSESRTTSTSTSTSSDTTAGITHTITNIVGSGSSSAEDQESRIGCGPQEVEMGPTVKTAAKTTATAKLGVTTLETESAFKLKSTMLEKELATWLARLMKRLVFSHTFLIRSMLDTIPTQFGIKTTVDMHLALLEYYAMLGKDGYKDTLAIVSKMNADNIFWKREVAVYDYLLFALSHISGNESRANRIIEDMLANDLVPREETMKAAILCAARSGDLEACSRYIRRMHEEWNLTISERMKAILLYACAKRGDFEGALEILGQLGRAGTLVHSEQRPVRSTMATATTQMAKKEVEKLLRERDVVDNSNVLMALINQTHARRGHGQQLTQEYVKEEVSKVLELFTVMTRDSKQVDTQLYTIMMQYLSTLPSPLPGMIYLYREMHSSEKAKPNYVTYRIMLEACAEHMDMDLAKQLWKDMEAARIVKDCRVRASFVKGWGRTGHLKTAERYTQEGMIAQRAIEKERIQYQVGFVVRNKRRREQGLPILEKMPRLPRRQRITGEMIDLGVLHELMRANRQHNQPERVYELYREIDAGEWGRKIRPNEFTLSIVLGACASGTTATELVDRGIELMDGYFNHQRYGFSGHTAPDGSAPDEMPDRVLDHGHGSDNGDDDEDKSEAGRDRQLELLGSETMPRKHFAPGEGGVKTRLLSDVNYQLYFAMLGRHHRQRKMVEVWDEMMETVEKPPSHLTVSLVTEALENVQWGAGPIKRLQRQLREKWPKVDWDGAKRGKRLGGASGAGGGEGEEGYEDDSVGAGGRFWK